MKNLVAGFLILFMVSTACAQTVTKSTLAEQKSVEVTVYNSNLGVVKDTREISLPAGEGELRFMDVAASINPVSVRVSSANRPNQFSVLEQNYEYDLISRQKLMEKYVGKDLKLLLWNQFQDRKEMVNAKLLAYTDTPIYQIENEIYLGHPGEVLISEMPENLIDKPTLTWLYKSEGAEPHRLEVSYMTDNINWKADYVVVLDTPAQMGVSGWVTVDNRSGAGYKNAKLKLIAGQVNRVQPPMPYAMKRGMVIEAMAMDAGGQFQEQEFFEYYMYNLQRKTTLKENQTKQISLMEAAGIQYIKEYIVQGQGYYFYGQQGGEPAKMPVNVKVRFVNAKKNKLGMPLPAGTMRIYQKDSEGSLQFIGEDQINHTPRDEEIKLNLGDAFDLVAERKQIDYRQLSTKMHESEWEISLRNRKKEAAEIILIEPVNGNWEVVKNSHPYEKKDAFTLQFKIKVNPDEEVKVRYRIRAGI